MDRVSDPSVAFAWLLGFAVANTLGSVALFSAIERALLSTRKLFDVPIRPGQVRREIVGNVVFCLMFAAAGAALLQLGAVRFSEFTWPGAFATFLGCMLSWDVYYFFLHRAMHAKPLRKIHDWHHQSRVNTPWASLSMSPAESVGWLIGLAAWPVAASAFSPVVPGALAAWLVFFWFSNAMGHVNVELVPASVSASPIGRQLSHPILYHALHHARYSNHYCFFLNSLDTAFGTVWEDYPELHRRVASGQPLQRLGERGERAAPSE